jgi:hypothetical protein
LPPRKPKNNFFTDPEKVKVIRDDSAPTDQTPWWDRDAKDAYPAIIATIENIKKNQLYAHNQLKLYEAMYGDNRSGVGRASYVNRFQGAAVNNTPRLALNIVQSCIDTLASKIASNKPKPQFIPNEGDWKLYSKAKLATDYLEGIFDLCKIYPKAQRMFTDACIYGISGLYVHSKFDQLSVDYLLRDEIIVDELDGHNETPSQLHLERFASKSKLCELYPKHADSIRKIPAVANDAHLFLNSSISDFIVFSEDWHLPSGPKASDGRYAVAINNETLLFEDYKHPDFPIEFFRPYHKPHSFWGRGLAETLFILQLSLNKLLKTTDVAHDLVAKPNWLLEVGSRINTDHINDRIGQIVEYAGTPPSVVAPNPMPEQTFQLIEFIISNSYQISGISQSSAAGEKPKDVESAVAMETVADIEAGRFENMSLSWNEFFMGLARKTMRVSADLLKKKPDLFSRLSKNNLVHNIKFSDLDFDEDSFAIQLFPINRLPHDPAGRQDAIERYIQAGWIDEVHGLSLLDMPDLSEENSLQTGSLHLARKMIAQMLDEGEEVSPIPEMDLNLAIVEAKMAIVNATERDYPEDHIALVVSFVSACKDMQALLAKQAQEQAQLISMQAQQSAQEQAAPLALPQKPQRSPLLPNAPPPPAAPNGAAIPQQQGPPS